MPLPPLPKAAKSSAVGPYLGFSLQQVRFCYYLLTSPVDHAISLELIDDVGIHRPDGTVVFEQAKSSISVGNPATNKAIDLWKTFANWAQTCNDLRIDPARSSFRYFVSEGKPGSLIKEINEATTPADSRKVLDKIKKHHATCEKDVTCEPYLRSFLEVGDSLCCQIIERCTFESLADPIAGIRGCLRVLPPDALDKFCAAAIGLAVNWVEKLIRERQPRAISVEEFGVQFRAFVRKHNFSNVLNPAIAPPNGQAIDAEILGAPLFVRQLNAVQASQAMVVTAVSDYMRTTADKVKWADDGVVFTDSFTELDDQLVRRHVIVCDEFDDVRPPLVAADRGKGVYRKCAETVLPLEGQTLPSYFVAGAFNCLAQIRRVGWHPDYENMFPPE